MDTSKPLKVKKDRLPVVIYTQDLKVEGEVHVFPASRLTDLMNSDINKPFVAVTNATVYDLSKKEPQYKADFLAINKAHVIMVFPVAHP